jgi:DNA-binding transcriptional MerR regulator
MRIGEVARRTGVSTRMLRHYESVGVVSASERGANGYRSYTSEDVERLLHVEGLRSLGMSLEQVRRALDEATFDPATVLARLIERSRARLARESEVLERLSEVAAAGAGDGIEVAHLVALVRDIRSPVAAVRQRSALRDEPVRLSTPALVAAVLREDDPNVRGSLAWALARRGDAAVDALDDGIHDRDPAVRRRAVETLAEIEGDRADSALARAVRRDDPVVRRIAARASAARGDATAVPVLLEMIGDGDRDVEAAELVAAVAARSGAVGEAVVALLALIDAAAADPDARLRYAQALGEFPSDDTASALVRLEQDDDPRVRRTAQYLRSRTR